MFGMLNHLWKNKRNTISYIFLSLPSFLLRMRAKFGSWLKRACAVRSLKFGVIRGSFRFGGKKSPAENRELVKWLFAGETRVILSSAKSFSFRITRTLCLVWWFSFWLDWCLRWVQEFGILGFFLVCVSDSCFSVSLSVFWLLHRNETCSFKTDQQTSLLIWMCKVFEIIIII